MAAVSSASMKAGATGSGELSVSSIGEGKASGAKINQGIGNEGGGGGWTQGPPSSAPQGSINSPSSASKIA